MTTPQPTPEPGSSLGPTGRPAGHAARPRSSGRVVVGIDWSENARAAADWANVEAGLRRAQLELLTVLPPPPLRSRHMVDEATRLQHGMLLRLRSRSGSGPVIASCQVGNDPARQLVDAASSADLLVVGARRHAGTAGLPAGSVGVHCAQRATCPVVVVATAGSSEGPPRRQPLPALLPIVVGVDDPPAVPAALRVAALEAALRGTYVIAVHVVPPRSAGNSRRAAAYDHVAFARRAIEERYSGVHVDTRVLLGPPGPVLSEAAGHATMLVIGLPRHDPHAGSALGPVALYLLTHARGTTVFVGN